MIEQGTRLRGAGILTGDELGTVLASLGPHGDARDRLAAVVALLADKADATGSLVRGAFAGVAPATGAAKVRSVFTSALHGCLREQPVNAPSPANTRSV